MNVVSKIKVSLPYNNLLKFRVLQISAYNNTNKKILSYDGSTRNNYIKFRIFKEKLYDHNYVMSNSQIIHLKDRLSINFDILNCSYDQLIYIFWYCDVENSLNQIYKFDYFKLNEFSKKLGVDMVKVIQMLRKYNNNYKIPKTL
jgi:hypothetical protein